MLVVIGEGESAAVNVVNCVVVVSIVGAVGCVSVVSIVNHVIVVITLLSFFLSVKVICFADLCGFYIENGSKCALFSYCKDTKKSDFLEILI